MRSLITGLLVLFVLSSELVLSAADFDGDGQADIAIFRASSGLWSARGITQFYFGGSGDEPVAGDYDGNGTDSGAIFRPSTGLWAVRGVTWVYFGNATDDPRPGDYNGDGRDDIGIFRGSLGLWAVRGITRVYYGAFSDVALPGKLCRLSITGQTFAYQTGDDGDHQAGAAFNFQTISIGGDLVTVDNNTGLMWALDGNGKGCAYGTTDTWSIAVLWADGLVFAGYSDWRLPNINELQSIVKYWAYNPAIDITYFTNTKSGISDYYWSSTTYYDVNGGAWGVSFREGNVDYDDKFGSNYARAVRGGE